MPSRPSGSTTLMSASEFGELTGLIREHFGISLDASKEGLLLARLRHLMKEREYHSVGAYLRAELANPTAEALSDLVDRVSTNHTFFYREPAHFDRFKALLPSLIASKRRANSPDLRVWCAASSSGEEPYLLAMLILEALGHERPRWKAGVLATDISNKALEVARTGIYAADNVSRLPSEMQRRWFRPGPGGTYEIVSELRDEVLFRRLNLMNERFPFKAPFDVIFCRNVMIYFDLETRAALIERLKRNLTLGGHLFLGHSESLPRGTAGFEQVQASAYRRTR